MATLARDDRLRGWVPVAIVVLAVLILVSIASHHPQLSRQQAIDAAVGKAQQESTRVAAKLVHRSDLERVAPEFGIDTGADFFVWVVAVSGDFGIRGFCPGCPPTTWGVALVKDQRPARLSATSSGAHGNWPPFFDRLVDLS